MRFNAANAREMAARGQIVKKANYLKRRTLESIKANPASFLTGSNNNALLARTRLQLDLIDEQLQRSKLQPDTWDALTRAKERLFKIYAHLSGLPGPGMRRPGKERSVATMDMQPIAPLNMPPLPASNGSPIVTIDLKESLSTT